MVEIGKDCYITQNAFNRWMIVSAEYRALAWSGARWVPHNQGVPTRMVQVSNFESKMEAVKDAAKAGLHVLTAGYKVTKNNITCFKCGMTSYNENDVKEKYCGNCHAFHEVGE